MSPILQSPISSVKRRALAILCLAVGAPLQAQFDRDAPEPVAPLAGALVLGGSEAESAAIASTVEAAGHEPRFVVLLVGEEVSEKARASATAALQDAGASDVMCSASEHTRAWIPSLADAQGVWLFGEADGSLEPTLFMAESRAALQSFVARGGVVGAHGEAAAALGSLRISTLGGAPHGAPGLDLLPRSIVAVGEGTRGALGEQLERRPDHVAYSLEAGALLVVKGRRVLGRRAEGRRAEGRRAEGRTAGRVDVRLAASAERAELVQSLPSPTGLDLIALTRAASARAGAAFPLVSPPEPRVEQGALILAGGGNLPSAVLKRFIELAGGPDAAIVFIPCSSAPEIVREPAMVSALRATGAKKVTWIHTKDRAQADNDEAILGPLREARGIWFGGGRQWNLVDSYQDTKAHELMHAVLARGGVIAGSSAGASIQADYLARGDPLGNRNIIAEGYERGLGFLTGVGVDQHFSQRRREADMRELLGEFPQLLGIGLDEGTAIVIRGSSAEVLASGNAKVWFHDAGAALEGDDESESMAVEGIGHRGRYDLVKRRRLGLREY